MESTSEFFAGRARLDSEGASNGASAQALAIDFSSFTQYGAAFAVSTVNQDGYTTGQLRGVEIDESVVLFTRIVVLIDFQFEYDEKVKNLGRVFLKTLTCRRHTAGTFRPCRSKPVFQI